MAWPLGKLWVTGEAKPKKGSGRGLWNSNFMI